MWLLINLVEIPVLHDPVIASAAEGDKVPIRGVVVGRTQQLDPAGLKAPFGVKPLYGPLLGDRLAAVVHRPRSEERRVGKECRL